MMQIFGHTRKMMAQMIAPVNILHKISAPKQLPDVFNQSDHKIMAACVRQLCCRTNSNRFLVSCTLKLSANRSFHAKVKLKHLSWIFSTSFAVVNKRVLYSGLCVISIGRSATRYRMITNQRPFGSVYKSFWILHLSSENDLAVILLIDCPFDVPPVNNSETDFNNP